MAEAPAPTLRIKKVLHDNPKGIGITKIAQKAGMHRSAAAKYLELLRASGHVEMRKMGMTKMYTLSQRVPLSAMLDFKDDIIVIIDGEGRIVQVNEQYETICGQSHRMIIGTAIGKTKLPILTDPEILSLFGALESPEVLVRSYRFPGDDFDRHFRIRLIPTVFEGGNTGVTLIAVDITREQETRKQLSDTETRYQAILDTLPDIVCMFLPDFSIILTNRAYRDWFGDSMRNDNEENFLDAVYGNEPVGRQQLVESMSRNALPVTMEQKIDFSGDGNGMVGQSRWIRWYFNPEYDTAGNFVKIQATGREITVEKEFGKILREKDRDIEFLSQKAFEFANLPPDGDVYQAISNGALQLVPDAIISLSSFDPVTCSLTVRTIVGDRGNVFKNLCNQSIGLNMPIDPEAIRMVKGKNLFQVPGGLHVVTFGQIPPMVCSRIEKKIHLVSTYSIGLFVHEKFLSAMGILKCGEGPIERPDTLTAYVRLSTLALQKWEGEKVHR